MAVRVCPAKCPSSSSPPAPGLLSPFIVQAGLQNGAVVVVSKLWGFNIGHFLGAGTAAGLQVPWATRVGWSSCSVALVLRSTFCINLCPKAALSWVWVGFASRAAEWSCQGAGDGQWLGQCWGLCSWDSRRLWAGVGQELCWVLPVRRETLGTLHPRPANSLC